MAGGVTETIGGNGNVFLKQSSRIDQFGQDKGAVKRGV